MPTPPNIRFARMSRVVCSSCSRTNTRKLSLTAISSSIPGQAEADAEAAILRAMRVAETTRGAVRSEVPTAAADDAQWLSVAGPFPDVSVHVGQAPGICRVRADRSRMAIAGALRRCGDVRDVNGHAILAIGA